HLAGTDPGAVVEPGRGTVLPALTIRRAPPAGSTSVIIPVRNDGERLDSCLRSLGPGIRQAGASLFLVDNDTRDETTLRILRDARRQGATVLDAPGDLGPAALRNLGAAAATGDRLCFLSAASEATGEDWLVELESRAAGPSVGAVGPIESHATGLVRQAGLVLGPGFGAVPAFRDHLSTGTGHLDLLRVAHQVSALDAAALLVPRAAFQSVGGFDDTAFPIFDHAIDLCLKLRARHLRIILTPHAVLRREEPGPDRHGGLYAPLAAREREEL
ncbi:MAG: glycosyltransferase family 2 protein, partial [Hyphomicrobiales bacterium]